MDFSKSELRDLRSTPSNRPRPLNTEEELAYLDCAVMDSYLRHFLTRYCASYGYAVALTERQIHFVAHAISNASALRLHPAMRQEAPLEGENDVLSQSTQSAGMDTQ